MKFIKTNLADYTSASLCASGVRKYDYMTGRFTSMDPLWEKYLGLTPWQYAGNNPVNWLDENGREVHVYSERIPSATLSRGTGSSVLGFVATLAEPRHTFVYIKTDKVNAVFEMGGPTNGSTKGTLIRTDLKEGDSPTNGRIWPKEAKVTEPKEKDKYEFENKIINKFNKYIERQDKLPDYNGYPGPNSNGFIEQLIESCGGKLNIIHGAYGQEIIVPYKKFEDQNGIK